MMTKCKLIQEAMAIIKNNNRNLMGCHLVYDKELESVYRSSERNLIRALISLARREKEEGGRARKREEGKHGEDRQIGRAVEEEKERE